MKTLSMKITPELSESLQYIQNQGFGDSEIGIILGSGLGSFADTLSETIRISADRIPHFPSSTVAGHKGNLIYGQLDSLPLIVLQGRTHVYEGYPLEKVTYIIRILKALGIKILIVTIMTC